MSWILLILSLPTENATVRMRAWRAIKALGAVSLRDGVYLLPAISDHAEKLEAIAQDVRDSGGTAHVLHANDPETEAFPPLFDRSEDYESLDSAMADLRAKLLPETAMEVMKETRKLRKSFTRLSAIDFFHLGGEMNSISKVLSSCGSRENILIMTLFHAYYGLVFKVLCMKKSNIL